VLRRHDITAALDARRDRCALAVFATARLLRDGQEHPAAYVAPKVAAARSDLQQDTRAALAEPSAPASTTKPEPLAAPPSAATPAPTPTPTSRKAAADAKRKRAAARSVLICSALRDHSPKRAKTGSDSERRCARAALQAFHSTATPLNASPRRVVLGR
jgi:hypothetical protein